MKKKRSFKTIKFLFILLILITTIFIGIGCSVYEKVIDETPIENKINEVRLSSNYVQAKDISKTFLDAIVAVEDHRFYKHGAIDFISIARAMIINIKSGEVIEGGSTITQQLAKNLFLSTEQTVNRKIDEAFIAHKLEKEYTKEEILELYVNVIYFGDGYTGIKEACNGYFDKDPSELNEDEATLLAGLPQAPSVYALNDNYNAALERQKLVIEALNKWKLAY